MRVPEEVLEGLESDIIRENYSYRPAGGFISAPTKSAQHVALLPRLAPGTELVGEYQGSGFKEPVYLVRRADGQFIQLARLPYLVAAEADGESGFEQIALRVSQDFGRTVSADNVRFFVEERLRPLGVLAATNGSNAKLPRTKSVLALTFRTPIVPEGVVEVLTTVFRLLFLAPVVIAILASFAALDLWLFFIHGISQSAVELLYQPENFLVVFGLAILSATFHELGHATACRYGGARPGRIGVGIYIVWPVFYSDVTDAYRLSKAGRLRVDLGGVYFNVIFVLATAGAYFVTKSEPLLFAVFIQQLGMLYQFMPFVRLDGYYVVSDLTGVPDLFARIKPTLKSAVPGRGPDERVGELKPWVRVVVTVWVLTAIPAVLYLFATLAIYSPLMYNTAWDSFFVHYDKVRSALVEGRVVEVIVGLLQIVLLLIPVAGVTLTFALFGKRLSRALWSWLRGKPPLRAGSASALPLGREGRLKKALERAQEDYESLVRTTASLGTMLAEEIQKRGDLGEVGRRRRELSLLTRQADLRRTELRHELLTLRIRGARKAFVEADGAARRSGLEARRLAEQRDKEARHLEELRRTAEKGQEERALSHGAPKESGLERSLGRQGSSEMKNVYDGVEQLDEDGAAWVELPEWFQALNKDFRYHLTAIGGAAPELHVAEEIADNRFRIAGGKAGMKVCWQVSGIRSDGWTEANPMVVEEEKPEEERGRYLDPSLYGAPEEQRIGRAIPGSEEAIEHQEEEHRDVQE
jgi:putative peptide zinc metalloprotease protein